MGCGSEAGDEGGGDASAEPAPATELTVTLWPQGRSGPSHEFTLTCDPPGGTHPTPAEACAILDADSAVLEPLPPDSICTELYGGPDEAEVVGTVNGEQVNASLSRQNGCEIDRWDRAAALLSLPNS